MIDAGARPGDRMRAAVLTAFGRPLVVRDVRVPAPGPDEVLIRVRATGLCGTDLKLVAGELGPGIRPPVIPGHEVAGDVVAGARGVEAGTRVACYVYRSCGVCRHCVRGHATLCPDAVRIGLERDGGLAEYLVARADTVIPFPDSLAYEAAAVAMDSVTTPWAALVGVAQVADGDRVLVVGAGGLGLNAVQIARSRGARVAVLDNSPEARDRAVAAGAECAVGPDDAGTALAWSDGGVDVMLEASGSPEGFRAGASCMAPRGRIVCCGYRPGGAYPIDSMALVLGELSVTGSRNASLDQARAALAAVAAGEIVPAIGRRLALDHAQDGIDLLRRGEAAGRVVIEP